MKKKSFLGSFTSLRIENMVCGWEDYIIREKNVFLTQLLLALWLPFDK